MTEKEKELRIYTTNLFKRAQEIHNTSIFCYVIGAILFVLAIISVLRGFYEKNTIELMLHFTGYMALSGGLVSGASIFLVTGIILRQSSENKRVKSRNDELLYTKINN